jgi:DNA-binding LacI/PurR family transcriptional regulator
VRDDGHDCFVVGTPKGKDPHKTGYLAKIVEMNVADAWVVYKGNLETLLWFQAKGIPTLAMGGRSEGSTLASATFCMKGALRELVRRLAALGHRRIVMISPKSSRHPNFSPLLQAFRGELENAGVKPGGYHTPEWDETPAGLFALMDSLFKITPPTALICWHANSPFGALSWLIGRRLKVPEEVSFFSVNDDPSFGWLLPGLTVAHIKYEESILRRRVRQWLECVATKSPPPLGLIEGAVLRPGDTLGPAKPGSMTGPLGAAECF